VSGRYPPLTTHRRLERGAVLRSGRSAPYRAIEAGAGEPHLVRDDFGAAGPLGADAQGPGRPLLCLAHITDLQLADVQSPARFEFLNARYADPRYAEILPVQRPQEALAVHAVDATIRTLDAVRGPASGLPPQLAVTTGDAIDNAQWNELQAFLALFEGGLVSPGSGGPDYEGVQSLDWPGDIFWRPDGAGPGGPDFFRREYGFPHHPGLLRRALREFTALGLGLPWLSCFGNHEALNQGVGTQTSGLAAALTGGKKPTELPADFDHDQALELFTSHPEAFMGGPSRPVTPDAFRRPISRRDFVDAHLRAGSRPFGHGFSERNRLDGTAYYVHDTPATRFIALDTNCLAGGAAGCLDREQARWLEARLSEVHSAYRGADGSEIQTGRDDRLVIVFSHHGTDTLDNARGVHPGPGGEPALGAVNLLAVLHRFPNVILWLNGHTHTNTIRPRHDPVDPARGFWEVTTCAVADWPCQTRVVELLDHGEYLSIVTTMVDHDTPLGPASLETSDDLAALHRELAANVPWAVSVMAGTTSDRNTELRVVPPFPLKRLPGLPGLRPRRTYGLGAMRTGSMGRPTWTEVPGANAAASELALSICTVTSPDSSTPTRVTEPRNVLVVTIPLPFSITTMVSPSGRTSTSTGPGLASAPWFMTGTVLSSAVTVPRLCSSPGSSSTRGSMASARASATRCCWPPDSWCGNCLACGARPTISSSSVALVRRTDVPTLRIRSPNPTLSSADMFGNRL
jgi:metallophosphoesterase (TIGR03767 family)